MMTDTLAWILYKDGYNRLDIIIRTDTAGWISLSGRIYQVRYYYEDGYNRLDIIIRTDTRGWISLSGQIEQVGYHYQDGYNRLDIIIRTDTTGWISLPGRMQQVGYQYQDGNNYRFDILGRMKNTNLTMIETSVKLFFITVTGGIQNDKIKEQIDIVKYDRKGRMTE